MLNTIQRLLMVEPVGGGRLGPPFTRQPDASGVTVNLVTAEDSWSVSVNTRPGSGSSTRMR
jgi:hypothetical protein